MDNKSFIDIKRLEQQLFEKLKPNEEEKKVVSKRLHDQLVAGEAIVNVQRMDDECLDLIQSLRRRLLFLQEIFPQDKKSKRKDDKENKQKIELFDEDFELDLSSDSSDDEVLANFIKRKKKTAENAPAATVASSSEQENVELKPAEIEKSEDVTNEMKVVKMDEMQDKKRIEVNKESQESYSTSEDIPLALRRAPRERKSSYKSYASSSSSSVQNICTTTSTTVSKKHNSKLQNRRESTVSLQGEVYDHDDDLIVEEDYESHTFNIKIPSLFRRSVHNIRLDASDFSRKVIEHRAKFSKQKLAQQRIEQQQLDCLSNTKNKRKKHEKLPSMPCSRQLEFLQQQQHQQQQDDELSQLIQDVMNDAVGNEETLQATTALENINNDLDDNYRTLDTIITLPQSHIVANEQLSLSQSSYTANNDNSTKKRRKNTKRSSDQQQANDEPPCKKRVRKTKAKTTTSLDSLSTQPQPPTKSNLAKYVEYFANDCEMLPTGSTTPAGSSTMSQPLVSSTTQNFEFIDQQQQPQQQQQQGQQQQQNITYFIDGDWANGGPCQLVQTTGMTIDPGQINPDVMSAPFQDFVNYIDNNAETGNNVIARVLDNCTTSLPISIPLPIANMGFQNLVQQRHSQQQNTQQNSSITQQPPAPIINIQIPSLPNNTGSLPPPPAHSHEEVLDLSAKSSDRSQVTIISSEVLNLNKNSNLTFDTFSSTNEDDVPLDLSLKSSSFNTNSTTSTTTMTTTTELCSREKLSQTQFSMADNQDDDFIRRLIETSDFDLRPEEFTSCNDAITSLPTVTYDHNKSFKAALDMPILELDNSDLAKLVENASTVGEGENQNTSKENSISDEATKFISNNDSNYASMSDNNENVISFGDDINFVDQTTKEIFDKLLDIVPDNVPSLDNVIVKDNSSFVDLDESTFDRNKVKNSTMCENENVLNHKTRSIDNASEQTEFISIDGVKENASKHNENKTEVVNKFIPRILKRRKSVFQKNIEESSNRSNGKVKKSDTKINDVEVKDKNPKDCVQSETTINAATINDLNEYNANENIDENKEPAQEAAKSTENDQNINTHKTKEVKKSKSLKEILKSPIPKPKVDKGKVDQEKIEPDLSPKDDKKKVDPKKQILKEKEKIEPDQGLKEDKEKSDQENSISTDETLDKIAQVETNVNLNETGENKETPTHEIKPIESVEIQKIPEKETIQIDKSEQVQKIEKPEDAIEAEQCHKDSSKTPEQDKPVLMSETESKVLESDKQQVSNLTEHIIKDNSKISENLETSNNNPTTKLDEVQDCTKIESILESSPSCLTEKLEETAQKPTITENPSVLGNKPQDSLDKDVKKTSNSVINLMSTIALSDKQEPTANMVDDTVISSFKNLISSTENSMDSKEFINISESVLSDKLNESIQKEFSDKPIEGNETINLIQKSSDTISPDSNDLIDVLRNSPEIISKNNSPTNVNNSITVSSEQESLADIQKYNYNAESKSTINSPVNPIDSNLSTNLNKTPEKSAKSSVPTNVVQISDGNSSNLSLNAKLDEKSTDSSEISLNLKMSESNSTDLSVKSNISLAENSNDYSDVSLNLRMSESNSTDASIKSNNTNFVEKSTESLDVSLNLKIPESNSTDLSINLAEKSTKTYLKPINLKMSDGCSADMSVEKVNTNLAEQSTEISLNSKIPERNSANMSTKPIITNLDDKSAEASSVSLNLKMPESNFMENLYADASPGNDESTKSCIEFNSNKNVLFSVQKTALSEDGSIFTDSDTYSRKSFDIVVATHEQDTESKDTKEDASEMKNELNDKEEIQENQEMEPENNEQIYETQNSQNHNVEVPMPKLTMLETDAKNYCFDVALNDEPLCLTKSVQKKYYMDFFNSDIMDLSMSVRSLDTDRDELVIDEGLQQSPFVVNNCYNDDIAGNTESSNNILQENTSVSDVLSHQSQDVTDSLELILHQSQDLASSEDSPISAIDIKEEQMQETKIYSLNRNDLTDLTPLELESKLEDTLDFEDFDDALSLATSCFDSPNDDRFEETILDETESQRAAAPATNVTQTKTPSESEITKNPTKTITITQATPSECSRTSTNVSNKFKIPKIQTISNSSTLTMEKPTCSIKIPSSLQNITIKQPIVKFESITRTVKNELVATAGSVQINNAPQLQQIKPTLQLHNSEKQQIKLNFPKTNESTTSNALEARHSRGVYADSERLHSSLNNIIQLFGITCMPYLVNRCYATTHCPLSHQRNNPESVFQALSTLSKDNLDDAYSYVFNHANLYQVYFIAFRNLYVMQKNRTKLLDMVTDCELYPQYSEFLIGLYEGLVQCGFSRVNACRQILKRSVMRITPIIDALVAIIMKSDWTMFTDSIEQFTDDKYQYKFRIGMLEQMAPAVLNSKGPQLKQLFGKCVQMLHCDDTVLLCNSPSLIQCVALLTSCT